MQIILATANSVFQRKMLAYGKEHRQAMAGLLGEEVELLVAGYAHEIGKLAPKCQALKLILFDTSQHQKREVDRKGFGRAGLSRAFEIAHAHSGHGKKNKINVAVMGYADHLEEMREAIALGAIGYIPVEFSEASFLASLILMLEGNTFFPAIPDAAQQKFATEPPLVLTRRERDVLRCLVEGKLDKEIAKIHNIAIVTVKHHMKSLRKKLGAKNRVHALARAIELGLAKQFTDGKK